MKLGATCSLGAALQCGGCGLGLVCMRGSHGRLPSRPPVLRPLWAPSCRRPPSQDLLALPCHPSDYMAQP